MKSNFNGKILRIFFLFCLAVSVGSCVVEESISEKDFSMDQALIQEAEEWYGSEYSGTSNARVNSLVDGNPSWDKAKTTMHKGKEVIEVPIKLRVKNIFAQENNSFKKESGDFRLLLFKIGDEKFRPYLFKAEQDTEEFKTIWKDLKRLSLTSIPDTFNGRYLFFQLDGGFVGSWEIENGVRKRAISYIKPLDPKSDLANSRISNYTYNCVITTYTTYTQAGSGEPYITEQYQVWDCIFTPMFAGTGPNDSGGGGSEGPGCYEPHPDFEGHLIPCEDPDPCNNFEDLVNKVLNTEGGFVNDPTDRGGATNKGISWNTWINAAQPILGRDPTIENLQNISSEDAKAIYEALYWNSIRLSEIEDGDLRWLIFDFHVNSGPNALYQLQKLLNELGAGLTVDGIVGSQTINFINNYGNIIELYNAYKNRRISFLENLIAKDVQKHLALFPNATENELKANTQLKFKNGWLNRVNEFINKTIENYTNVNC